MKRVDWDAVGMVAITLLMIILAILLANSARAETCLAIDVQPSQVLSNYDGDTFTLSLGALGQVNIRVEGVDTPERNKKRAGWKEAKEFTQRWLATGPFQLNTCFVLTLGRIVASPSRNGDTLASALIANGHGKPR